MAHAALVFALVVAGAFAPAAATTRTVFVSYAEARPVLEALDPAVRAAMPADLRGRSPEQLRVEWGAWVAERDAEIRSRLEQGDADSIVNLLLFGVSFTRQPRATENDISRVGQGKSMAQIVAARLDDLVAGIASPGDNERLQFARGFVERRGIDPTTPSGRAKTKDLLATTMSRVFAEAIDVARAIESAKQLGDRKAELARRSTIYHDRGLSSDTSILPAFAIEQSLESMKAQGLLAAETVRRVAIVGPGLDFADKAGGYDFYPQQTIQPFAVIDSLLRLGLAKSADLQLTTYDLSPRVNEHLSAARNRAAGGGDYTLQLVRDPAAGWTPALVGYWQHFGDQIGVAAWPLTPPGGADALETRAVTLRPDVVAQVAPEDLDIVFQHPDRLAAEERFDLVIATNILVYYDVFEQSLALTNVSRMLRPGGFLLSNNALFELEAIPMRSAGNATWLYSDRPDDGDQIFWYRRIEDPAPAH